VSNKCFILGDGPQGLEISRELHRKFPDNVGLHSNLALALLIGGYLDEALATARAANARDPSDPIAKNLLDHIVAVKSGGRSVRRVYESRRHRSDTTSSATPATCSTSRFKTARVLVRHPRVTIPA
jgi:hypothetical protein